MRSLSWRVAKVAFLVTGMNVVNTNSAIVIFLLGLLNYELSALYPESQPVLDYYTMI